jgi:hypothetical protein
MKKDWSLTQEAFDLLLVWLSPDKDKAGIIYEEVRKGLIKLFLIRGCNSPETLADETINRVTSKLPSIISEYKGNPIHYFYSVANIVHLESTSAQKKKEEQLDSVSHRKYLVASSESEDVEIKLKYLISCLQELSVEDRDLITQYFAVDRSAKFEHRRLLGENRGLNLNSLRIRIVRLKKKLLKCVLGKFQMASEISL